MRSFFFRISFSWKQWKMNNELALQFCKTIVNSVKSSWTHETLMHAQRCKGFSCNTSMFTNLKLCFFSSLLSTPINESLREWEDHLQIIRKSFYSRRQLENTSLKVVSVPIVIHFQVALLLITRWSDFKVNYSLFVDKVFAIHKVHNVHTDGQ